MTKLKLNTAVSYAVESSVDNTDAMRSTKQSCSDDDNPGLIFMRARKKRRDCSVWQGDSSHAHPSRVSHDGPDNR